MLPIPMYHQQFKCTTPSNITYMFNVLNSDLFTSCTYNLYITDTGILGICETAFIIQ
jgi:hypothetical protein